MSLPLAAYSLCCSHRRGKGSKADVVVDKEHADEESNAYSALNAARYARAPSAIRLPLEATTPHP
jgi:hypothetical protein